LEDVYKKVRSYQSSGVPIVWVINPRKLSVEVYHHNQIEPVEELGLDGQLEGSDVIPGFTMPVKALFE
jgi:Uma2 family endonuclease